MAATGAAGAGRAGVVTTGGTTGAFEELEDPDWDESGVKTGPPAEVDAGVKGKFNFCGAIPDRREVDRFDCGVDLEFELVATGARPEEPKSGVDASSITAVTDVFYR